MIKGFFQQAKYFIISTCKLVHKVWTKNWDLFQDLKFRRSVNGDDKDQLLDFVVKYFSANPINILFDAQGALLDTFNDICAGDGGMLKKSGRK